MTVEIRWAGINGRSVHKRVWGYLIDKKEEDMFTHYNLVKTFWGTVDGKITFHSTTATKVFYKNVVEKRRKYCIKDAALEDRIRTEYEQEQIMRRLKH